MFTSLTTLMKIPLVTTDGKNTKSVALYLTIDLGPFVF